MGVIMLAVTGVPTGLRAQAAVGTADFWASRDVEIPAGAPPVRMAIWDSGVDTTLLSTRLVRDGSGRHLVRGYDSFKRRQDTPMAVLSPDLLASRDELNAALQAFDDMDGGIDSPRAKAMDVRMKGMAAAERAAFQDRIGLWGGYVHGTNVADIALTGHATAEIVVARMEWWHGTPPVPCWTRELADREATSIADLLAFIVESGARVVTMSWGRAETAYIRNLEQCAPSMPAAERTALARYTVDTIRAVLRAGMAGAPRVLFVGASGNAGASLEAANPATRFSLPNFVLVGAVDRAGRKTDFSNTGAEVTLFANGDRVKSRLPGGALSYPTGTSMAVPLVAGAAAKVLAVDSTLSGAALRALLEATADTNTTGQRLLHPARAVARARAEARR